jgi:hypothetical protein
MMKMMKSPTLLLAAALLLLWSSTVSAFNYGLTGEIEALKLVDYETSIEDIKTIFTNEITLVSVTGVKWNVSGNNVSDTDDVLRYETSVDGIVQSTGTVNLSALGDRELLDTIDCGNVSIPNSGRATISVALFVDNTTATTDDAENEYEAYAAAAAIVPLIIVLVLALTTHMVEVSLFCAIFVGACMVTGNIKDGFKTTLDDYILNALANVDHAYVYLFTLFLSGMVIGFSTCLLVLCIHFAMYTILVVFLLSILFTHTLFSLSFSPFYLHPFYRSE